ncbi:MAG TPA: hypothetical protein VHE99_09720 [Gammaproteobacteria bacterium]|nr:hypothetical protein [Gammaproteobacteria bacterium]
MHLSVEKETHGNNLRFRKHLLRCKCVYLPYLPEGYPEFAEILSHLAGYIDEGSLQAFTSELSLAEVLVKPIKDKQLALQNLYESTIQTTSNLTGNRLSGFSIIFLKPIFKYLLW